jgi:hypothetical protein
MDYSIFNWDINFSFGINIINYLVLNSMLNESRYIAGQMIKISWILITKFRNYDPMKILSLLIRYALISNLILCRIHFMFAKWSIKQGID